MAESKKKPRNKNGNAAFCKGNKLASKENRDMEKEKQEKGLVGMQINDILAKGVPDAAEFMVKVVQGIEYPDELKAKCAMYIFDRLIGKPGITVDANVDKDITVTLSEELKEFAK